MAGDNNLACVFDVFGIHPYFGVAFLDQIEFTVIMVTVWGGTPHRIKLRPCEGVALWENPLRAGFGHDAFL